ncbi:TrmH family RNA methyltransferase [Clostridium tetanomorphum]|uniref:RNA methyltransferase n=1 Tax=Clostridium tetanomorphum TaxID=1553 RepID=A0A923ECS6_CLOTT|nr:RNA methyltransferase [Clostridium tetanomorphum]KAJ50756.1 RNA methyltransferase [Clostridium tetanomorphum DSM 665]MBC2399529.1 RNA methyltransferase [Clostridium tetanomorphum]MBP1866554.1 TrmH family RNA methyltransferase [Clostridium tetanomorphum]NRS85823.1 TrmH family RNA methyltransferase [Clostridium tetanomorphum]NRZ96169.1 TrmH family RNA methyltransferase [Clostridium tetanomorphum]
MEIISSKDNSTIKEVRKLKEKKYRKELNKFLVEGFRFVGEALDSQFNVSKIFLCDNSLDRYESFHIKDKINENTKVYLLNEKVFKIICSTDTPQGIVAIVDNRSLDIQDKKGFYVLVDKIQDPGNMGTIIRTSHAAGALGIIMTRGTVDVYNEKTLRSTMGSIFHIPVVEDDNFQILNSLINKGFKILASSLQSDKNFYDLNLKESKVIISIGNEGNGISDEIYNMAHQTFKIPMPGGAESLNAAVAASIIMFEVVRQNYK